MASEKGNSPIQGLTGKVWGIACVLALAYVVANSYRPMLDNVDLGWHIAQGRWMAEHASIYRHDLFNYPNYGQPAVDEYPFFQIVLYFAWKLGWWGPCLLTAAGYVGLIGLLVRAALAFRLEGSGLFLLSLGSMILYLQLAFPLRPHLVTYLCLVILVVFLLRHREAKTWMEFWPLGVLQIIWTNSHSAFVLGPALAGFFGLEMIFRRGVAEKTIPWPTIRVWSGAFLLLFLACFVNPFGVARFYPVFYQEHLESIRAYVNEMQPLGGGMATLYFGITLISAGAVALAAFSQRAISYSLLFTAVLLYLESLAVRKAWPVFGLFIPLLILSSGAFSADRAKRKIFNGPGFVLNFFLATLFAIALANRLDGSGMSIQTAWHEYDLGRSELSFQAVDWMKAHHIEGRLLHRCEDGGCLQEAGYDHAETFGDTGFGKYDAAFIHLQGLLGERPALVPDYLQIYQPSFVVCGGFCFAWPYYLRQKGWHPIFYSLNSSVWAQAGMRPDLSPVSDKEVKAIFEKDLAAHGLPLDLMLYGRDILTLNSMGLEDLAFATLTGLPNEFHHAPWYWEAARILCFDSPPLPAEQRHRLLKEADQLHANALTAEFRAYAHEADGDTAGARKILEDLPLSQLGAHAEDLLMKLEITENPSKALALAQRREGFDLRDGIHWKYVAEIEGQAGHRDVAEQAWEKAVFYCPDDSDLMKEAGLFEDRNHSVELRHEIEEIHKAGL